MVCDYWVLGFDAGQACLEEIPKSFREGSGFSLFFVSAICMDAPKLTLGSVAFYSFWCYFAFHDRILGCWPPGFL